LLAGEGRSVLISSRPI